MPYKSECHLQSNIFNCLYVDPISNELRLAKYSCKGRCFFYYSFEIIVEEINCKNSHTTGIDHKMLFKHNYFPNIHPKIKAFNCLFYLESNVGVQQLFLFKNNDNLLET